MKKVKIEGYLFWDEEEILLFVPKSNWNIRGCDDHSTIICNDDEVCKEGEKIYEAFHDFKGKRKKVTITVEG